MVTLGAMQSLRWQAILVYFFYLFFLLFFFSLFMLLYFLVFVIFFHFSFFLLFLLPLFSLTPVHLLYALLFSNLPSIYMNTLTSFQQIQSIRHLPCHASPAAHDHNCGYTSTLLRDSPSLHPIQRSTPIPQHPALPPHPYLPFLFLPPSRDLCNRSQGSHYDLG